LLDMQAALRRGIVGARLPQVVAFHNPSIHDYMAVRAARDMIPLSPLIDSIDDRARISHLLSVASRPGLAELTERLREHAAVAAEVIIRTFEDVETSLSEEDESWASNLEYTL